MSFAVVPLPLLPIRVMMIRLKYCSQHPERSDALLVAVLLPDGVGAPMNVIRLVRQAGGGEYGNGNGSSSQENDGSETYEESADAEEEEEYYDEASEEDLDEDVERVEGEIDGDIEDEVENEEEGVSWENYAWVSII